MNIRDAIAQTGAVLEGEFFFALKKRGTVANKYINMDPAFTYPDLVCRLGTLLIEMFEWRVGALAVPAVGAIPLAYAAPRSTFKSLRIIWADKQPDGSFAFERMGFAEAIRDMKVGIIEDVATTGGSAKAVGNLVEQAGGEVFGYSFVWNRGGITEETMGAPVTALVEETVPTWAAGEHKMWGKWPLVEDIGHPDYFPDYPGPRIKLLK
ncbi:MAG: hypothetical protein Q8P58_02465 [Candidatus Adlerbacteria bacterium]|nr:hypothetical protein [Candidatus Adlerbacteria bacterium]